MYLPKTQKKPICQENPVKISFFLISHSHCGDTKTVLSLVIGLNCAFIIFASAILSVFILLDVKFILIFYTSGDY